MDLPAIVIPTYTNTKGLTSLLNQLSSYEGGVIVVDNKPDFDKKHLVRHTVKRGVYLPQEKNTGFAKAVNIGARQANSKWLLVMNDDIILPAVETIGQMVKKAEELKWTALSPILVNPEGKPENIGYTVLPIGKVKLNFDEKKNSSKELDGITAACMLIERSVFEKIGGFDESFFAYLEDVDLCLRLKKQGYVFGIITDMKVIHQHRQTSSQMGWFKEKQDLKNWMKVIGKNWDMKTIMTNCFGILVERGRNLSGLLKKMP